MSRDREQRAIELFREALECDQRGRAALVQDRCAGDEALLRAVESLLEADRAAGSFLEPVSDPPHPRAVDRIGLLVGRRVGRYVLRRLIAAGGMGAVFEAVQDLPQRIVALKIMRHGLATGSALRRFDREARLLARLRHPGIAQIYEAGIH